MQDTMHVQPLSFQDRYASSSYAESRPRKSSTTYSSSFTSTSASSYAAAEPSSAEDHGVPLTRRKHHPQLHFFDEALGEEGADASVLEDEVSRQSDREGVEYEEEEEDKEPVMPRRRRYLTEAEYQREAADYTKQQLKQSGIYYKHAYHFWRLRSRDSADLLRQHLVKVLIALAVLIVPIVLGLYLANDGGSFGSKPDVSMLPDLAQNKFPSNAAAAEEQSHQGRSLFNRLMRRAGLAAKRENDTLVPAPLAAKDAAKPIPSPVAQQKQEQQQQKGETVNHIGVYEEPGLGFSILPSMEGMNIFSFAYTAAIDFFSKTFGWESSNVTAATAA
jgi:hypothetical protein